jgi:hypothetical protein
MHAQERLTAAAAAAAAMARRRRRSHQLCPPGVCPAAAAACRRRINRCHHPAAGRPVRAAHAQEWGGEVVAPQPCGVCPGVSILNFVIRTGVT